MEKNENGVFEVEEKADEIKRNGFTDEEIEPLRERVRNLNIENWKEYFIVGADL